jgi:uncharacterized damage-inducible protein DinB
MTFSPPTDPGAHSDETELLLAFLQTQRALVAWSAADLSDEQAHWRPDGKLISVIGIVNHLTHVERRWIDGSFLRRPVEMRSESEFTPPADRRITDVLAAYADRATRTDAAVRAAPDLGVACLHPHHPGIDLRWVLVHLVEETAHHAGHADSTREMLDGRTSGW